jgi:hypothetical protein
MTYCGSFGDDKKGCHSGVGLAGIQYRLSPSASLPLSFPRVPGGNLKLYMDARLKISGMTKKVIIPAWAWPESSTARCPHPLRFGDSSQSR